MPCTCTKTFKHGIAKNKVSKENTPLKHKSKFARIQLMLGSIRKMGRRLSITADRKSFLYQKFY
jgi:hypothetical protein